MALLCLIGVIGIGLFYGLGARGTKSSHGTNGANENVSDAESTQRKGFDGVSRDDVHYKEGYDLGLNHARGCGNSRANVEWLISDLKTKYEDTAATMHNMRTQQESLGIPVNVTEWRDDPGGQQQAGWIDALEENTK